MNRQRGVRILAKSMWRSMREQGYEATDIVNLATELLGQVTEHLAAEPEQPPLPRPVDQRTARRGYASAAMQIGHTAEHHGGVAQCGRLSPSRQRLAAPPRES